MKQCRKCGKEVSETAQVCPHCGEEHPGSNVMAIVVNLIKVAIGLAFLCYGCYQFGRWMV